MKLRWWISNERNSTQKEQDSNRLERVAVLDLSVGSGLWGMGYLCCGWGRGRQVRDFSQKLLCLLRAFCHVTDSISSCTWRGNLRSLFKYPEWYFTLCEKFQCSNRVKNITSFRCFRSFFNNCSIELGWILLCSQDCGSKLFFQTINYQGRIHSLLL